MGGTFFLGGVKNMNSAFGITAKMEEKKLITFFATFSASGARKKNFRDFLFSSDSCY